MSRTLCASCQRPEKACICTFTTDIANDIHVVVLQHPTEVAQTKGTIALLAKSLRSCQVIVAENFTDDKSFLAVMQQYQPLLLYPSEKAQILSRDMAVKLTNKTAGNAGRPTKPYCLVVLDGTWKKAYKMFMLSGNLQTLPQVCVPEHLANAGQYHIRKVAKKNALSSLEASCYALAILEQGNDGVDISVTNTGKYQTLLDKFNQFNQFQLSFRPEQSNTPRKYDDS